MYMSDINVVGRAVVDAHQMERDGRKLEVKTRSISNEHGVIAYRREGFVI